MTVFFGARLFDGERFFDDHALVVEDGVVLALVDVEQRPRGGEAIDCGGGILMPGLIDWQINGGGGVLFNAEPTVEGIARIARAHRPSSRTRRRCWRLRSPLRERPGPSCPARSGFMSRAHSSTSDARAFIRRNGFGRWASPTPRR
jgi:hypothetical protein